MGCFRRSSHGARGIRKLKKHPQEAYELQIAFAKLGFHISKIHELEKHLAAYEKQLRSTLIPLYSLGIAVGGEENAVGVSVKSMDDALKRVNIANSMKQIIVKVNSVLELRDKLEKSRVKRDKLRENLESPRDGDSENLIGKKLATAEQEYDTLFQKVEAEVNELIAEAELKNGTGLFYMVTSALQEAMQQMARASIALVGVVGNPSGYPASLFSSIPKPKSQDNYKTKSTTVRKFDQKNPKNPAGLSTIESAVENEDGLDESHAKLSIPDTLFENGATAHQRSPSSYQDGHTQRSNASNTTPHSRTSYSWDQQQQQQHQTYPTQIETYSNGATNRPPPPSSPGHSYSNSNISGNSYNGNSSNPDLNSHYDNSNVHGTNRSQASDVSQSTRISHAYKSSNSNNNILHVDPTMNHQANNRYSHANGPPKPILSVREQQPINVITGHGTARAPLKSVSNFSQNPLLGARSNAFPNWYPHDMTVWPVTNTRGITLSWWICPFIAFHQGFVFPYIEHPKFSPYRAQWDRWCKSFGHVLRSMGKGKRAALGPPNGPDYHYSREEQDRVMGYLSDDFPEVESEMILFLAEHQMIIVNDNGAIVYHKRDQRESMRPGVPAL